MAALVPAARTGLVAVLLPLAVAFAGLPDPRAASAETVSAEAVDALLDATGLRHQARLLAAQAGQTLQGGLGELSDADAERVERIARWHFNPDAFYARLRSEFSGHVVAARVAETRAWFATPVGLRIVAAEIEFHAADRRGEVEEFAAGLSGARPSPTRVALLQRLDAALGATERSLDLVVAMHRAIVRVMEPTVPASQRLGMGQIESQGRRIRLLMQEPLRTVTLATALFLYRGVTDDDLRRYIDFMESDAGAWYGAAARRATVTTIVATVERSADELLRVVPTRRWTGGGAPPPRRPPSRL